MPLVNCNGMPATYVRCQTEQGEPRFALGISAARRELDIQRQTTAAIRQYVIYISV